MKKVKQFAIFSVVFDDVFYERIIRNILSYTFVYPSLCLFLDVGSNFIFNFFEFNQGSDSFCDVITFSSFWVDLAFSIKQPRCEFIASVVGAFTESIVIHFFVKVRNSFFEICFVFRLSIPKRILNDKSS